MKRVVTFRLESNIVKKLKVYATMSDITVQQILEEYVTKLLNVDKRGEDIGNKNSSND